MSMELFVLLATASAPTGETWKDAMADTSARFETKVNLSEHSGFLPVVVNGRKTGFYFGTERYSELVSTYPALGNVKMDSPIVYSLGYGGDFRECAAAFLSAAVLVSKFGGRAFEPQAGVFMSTEDLRLAAAECLEQSE